MTDSSMHREIKIDKVVRFNKGCKEVVCLIGSEEITFAVSDVEFVTLPVVLGEDNRMRVSRWVILNKGLQHLL